MRKLLPCVDILFAAALQFLAKLEALRMKARTMTVYKIVAPS
jgi:hypothetical protein